MILSSKPKAPQSAQLPVRPLSDLDRDCGLRPQQQRRSYDPSAVLSAQVRWQAPAIAAAGIDQTHLVIADAPVEPEAFSFTVMGDTDEGGGTLGRFSQGFAAELLLHARESRFLLHTGDLTYPMGSYENYLRDFLLPYRALLSRIPDTPAYCSQDIVFNKPLLPVPGNHDYADIAAGSRWWHRLVGIVCDRLRQIGLDLGCYGGQGGEAFGQTFLDDLARLSPEQLSAHLRDYYSAVVGRAADRRYCLGYHPGHFTRLPNRYYSFSYGGVDFFALDSNTWARSPEQPGFDHLQLDWLEQSLIRSWRSPGKVARIVYLHHSPYTTEELRWQRLETLWTRRHLRNVLDNVALALGRHKAHRPESAPLVDLFISGHAHCLEHIRTRSTGHADSYCDWIVCGGSGAGLRRQRMSDSADILEKLSGNGRSRTDVVARSHFYAGIQGRGEQKQYFYSFINVDIQPHQFPNIVVRPQVVTRTPYGWQTNPSRPLQLGFVPRERLAGLPIS